MKCPTDWGFARWAIGVFLLAVGASSWAGSPYPPLPVSLSASVTPNVLLMIDNSGSMDDCPGGNTRGCTKKITTARNVANSLVAKNPALRWGVFSFDPNSNETGGILQAPVGSSGTALKTAIDGLGPDTWTPLGEALFEVGRYWAGETSYYSKTRNAPGGQYTSPIQYRCQKNFNIVITDGESTKDNRLPGNPISTRPAVSYSTLNAAGTRVNMNFRICTDTTQINDNISCPARLEGAANDTGSSFGTETERKRSLRDVSALLFDKDMRFNLATTDVDGKSWDDPKFPKQNVQTYVVGFDFSNDVLRAAAHVGKGEYFTAANETELVSALNTAVASIINSLSNSGGLATSSTALQSGSKLFQPLYNPKGWFGELLCYDLSDTGVATACPSVPKATIPAASSRTLLSAKVVGGTTTPFLFNDTSGFTAMTTTQKNNLGTTDAIRKNVINFVRGVNVSGFRARPNGLLGDIIDSQPLVISKPSGQTPDSTYAAFQNTHKDRSMVFIGANDGMLHGFTTSNMAEFFGYVPSSVYPNLPALTKTDYGEGSANPHEYFVNGPLRQQDVKIGTDWQTLLVGGLGQGGQGYFALTATSTAALTASALTGVKWEFTDNSDSAMGYSFGAPVIYNVRTSSTTAVPAVILSNGYEADFDDVSVGGVKASAKSSALYIVRVSDGSLLKKIPAPSGSGLSAPVGVDFGQDGVLDYVYAGDIDGKLWRFDLTANSPASFTVATQPIFDAGTSKPIIMRPAVVPVNKSSDQTPIGNLILFGTGKLLVDTDRSNTAAQTFYAVLDKMESSPTTVTLSSLQEQTVESVVNVNRGTGYLNGNYRVVSDSTLDLTSATNTKRGWYLNLPTSSERLMTAPVVIGNKILFATGITVSGEACSPGKGWLMGLDALTGAVAKTTVGKKAYSFIDVKLDGRANADDSVAAKSNTERTKLYASGYELGAIPTELTFISKSASVATVTSVDGELGTAGSSVAIGDSNLTGVYTANAASGVSAGKSTGRPSGSGAGKLFVPTVGDSGLNSGGGNPFDILEGSVGVKIETTLWREIK